MNGGDEGAFEVLYYRHRDWVVNLARRFSGDADLGLDVLQETFFYFLKKFPGFTLTCQFRSFLYPVVRNLSLTARRKAERGQSDGAELDELPAFASCQPEDRESGHSHLAEVLAGLSEEHREVLLLRFVDGLRLGEIAEAMEIPLGTVKSRLHNALELLREDPRTKEFFAP